MPPLPFPSPGADLSWINALGIALGPALGGIALAREIRRRSHFYFAWLCLVASLYNLSQFLLGLATTPADQLLCVKLGYVAAFLTLPALLNFPRALRGHQAPPAALDALFWGVSVAAIPGVFLSDMLTIDSRTGFVGRIGWQFLPGVPFFAFGIIGFLSSLRTEMKASRSHDERNRVAWILLGTALFVATAVPDVLRRTQLVRLLDRPVAAYGTLAFLLCAAYAVLRHRLLDIEVVISRALVYSGLIVMLGAVYAVVGELVEGLTQDLIDATSAAGNLISALAVAGLFDPTRRLLNRKVNRLFLADPALVDALAELERAPALVIAGDAAGLERLRAAIDRLVVSVRDEEHASRSAGEDRVPARDMDGGGLEPEGIGP